MNTRKRLINLKVNQDEFARIHELALLHAGGNVSLWLRSRGMTEEPLGEEPPTEDEYPDSDETD